MRWIFISLHATVVSLLLSTVVAEHGSKKVEIIHLNPNSDPSMLPVWHHFLSLEDLALREDKPKILGPTIPTGYVVNKPGSGGANDRVDPPKPPQPIDKQSQQVTETDLYLLGAIEKLVYRVDLMDKRLRRTEELLQHVIEGGSNQREDPCPGNFTRVARNCYHFSERQFNWKSAMSMCKSLGGNLLELESKEEYTEFITFLLADKQTRGHDFWTGGLNPGLLWIWANSAQPVVKKNSNRPEDEIAGNGRCLKIAYNTNSRIYHYYGADCGARQRYVCEHEENTTLRALRRIHKALKDKSEL